VGVAVVQYSGLLVADAARDRDWFAVVALALVGLGAAIPALRGFVPAGTLRLRSGLPSVVATRGFLAGGFFGAEAFLPLMLVEHRGWSVTLAGMSLTGAALGWSTGSWLMGGRAPRSDAAGRRARAGRFAARGAAVAAAGVAATGLVSIDTAALTVPSALAPVAWVLTGLGMGMAMSSLSVLLFELSPVEERGANSAALQISDAVGSIAVIALAGVVYATSQAHGSTSGAAVGQGADAGSAVFAGVYAITLLVAVGAAVVATRVLPRWVRAPERVVTAGGPPA
jgi:MFS family permease